MPNTPLKKAIGRAKDAHRLMMTYGRLLPGLSRENNVLHEVLWRWTDPHTNIIVFLKSGGAYSHKEVTHA